MKNVIVIIGIVLLAAVANVAAAHDKKRLRNRKIRAAPPAARPMTDKERQRLKLMELELPYIEEQIENMRLMVDMLGDMDELQRDKYYVSDEKGLKRIITTTKQLYAVKKQLAALELKREKIIERLKGR